jgi:hypothetical protein
MSSEAWAVKSPPVVSHLPSPRRDHGLFHLKPTSISSKEEGILPSSNSQRTCQLNSAFP